MLIFILNILWFVLGGFFAGLGWILAGVIMAITIVGIPWARSCFMLARYTFWPFGYDIVSREQLYGEHDIGTGARTVLSQIAADALGVGLDAVRVELGDSDFPAAARESAGIPSR